MTDMSVATAMAAVHRANETLAKVLHPNSSLLPPKITTGDIHAYEARFVRFFDLATRPMAPHYIKDTVLRLARLTLEVEVQRNPFEQTLEAHMILNHSTGGSPTRLAYCFTDEVTDLHDGLPEDLERMFAQSLSKGVKEAVYSRRK